MRPNFCKVSGSSVARADKYATKLKLNPLALRIDKKVKFRIAPIIIAIVSKLVVGIYLMYKPAATPAMYFLKLNAHLDAVSLAREILTERSGIFAQIE